MISRRSFRCACRDGRDRRIEHADRDDSIVGIDVAPARRDKMTHRARRSYTRAVAEIVVATCTYRGTHDLAESLERHHRLIDEAADTGASLVVFPEISLHGYPSIEMTEKRLRA